MVVKENFWKKRRIEPARGADCQQFLNDIGYLR